MESIPDAAARAPDEPAVLQPGRDRSGFRVPAQQTPGAEIARAKALPLLHPKYRLKRASVTGEAVPEVPIPGVLTVAVVSKVIFRNRRRTN